MSGKEYFNFSHWPFWSTGRGLFLLSNVFSWRALPRGQPLTLVCVPLVYASIEKWYPFHIPTTASQQVSKSVKVPLQEPVTWFLTPFKQNLPVLAIMWGCLVPRSVLADSQSRATGAILVPRKGSWEMRSPLRQHRKLPCSITRYSLIDRSSVFYPTVEAPRNQAAQGESPQVLRLRARLARFWVEFNHGNVLGTPSFLGCYEDTQKLVKNWF